MKGTVFFFFNTIWVGCFFLPKNNHSKSPTGAAPPVGTKTKVWAALKRGGKPPDVYTAETLAGRQLCVYVVSLDHQCCGLKRMPKATGSSTSTGFCTFIWYKNVEFLAALQHMDPALWADSARSCRGDESSHSSASHWLCSAVTFSLCMFRKQLHNKDTILTFYGAQSYLCSDFRKKKFSIPSS